MDRDTRYLLSSFTMFYSKPGFDHQDVCVGIGEGRALPISLLCSGGLGGSWRRCHHCRQGIVGATGLGVGKRFRTQASAFVDVLLRESPDDITALFGGVSGDHR